MGWCSLVSSSFSTDTRRRQLTKHFDAGAEGTVSIYDAVIIGGFSTKVALGHPRQRGSACRRWPCTWGERKKDNQLKSSKIAFYTLCEPDSAGIAHDWLMDSSQDTRVQQDGWTLASVDRPTRGHANQEGRHNEGWSMLSLVSIVGTWANTVFTWPPSFLFLFIRTQRWMKS